MSPPDGQARRLLLVSYWYPPGVGAAAERMHSFARYLPEHGWDVHVVTAARSGNAPQDRGVTVHAVPDPLSPSSPAFADYDPRRKPSRLRAWLREWTFPDRFIAWRRTALQVARRLIEKGRVDLVMVSFPPASVIDLALRLHDLKGPPIVLDFRDRWLGPGGYEPASERARRKHLDLERRCINAATALVTVSEAMADAIAAEQGFARERIFVVPNGYDENAAAPPPRISDSKSQICISHVGTVIPRNRPDLFFQSVAELRRAGNLSAVNFEFVGNLSRDYLQSLGLDDVIRATGLVPRDEARRRMAEADALLLLTGEYVGRWGYNAKLFEYVRSGRPILCLEERLGSNDRRLLEAFAGNHSFFAPMGDAAALGSTIGKLGDHLKRHPETCVFSQSFDVYSRRNLAARLAGYLSHVIR